MGVSLQINAIDDAMRRRILSLIDDEDAEDPEELLEAIEAAHEGWWPDRGDGKSWDVLHWALTGSGASGTSLFGAVSLDIQPFAEFNAVLDPPQVAALAAELERVDEAQMRERLARVPSELYWAETFGAPAEHDMLIEDAGELVAYLRRAANEGLALLLLLG